MAKKTLKERLKNWWKENKRQVMITLGDSLMVGGTAFMCSRLAYKYGHYNGVWEGIGTASSFDGRPHNLHQLGINNDTNFVLQQECVRETMAEHNLTPEDIKRASIVINAELTDSAMLDSTKTGKVTMYK